MLASLGLILLCQLIGEAVVRGLGLSMPGPVLGLLLLLILLLARDRFALLRRRLLRHRHEPERFGDLLPGTFGGHAAGAMTSSPRHSI
jgi:hypothetical protein